MGYRSHMENALTHFSNNAKNEVSSTQVCCSGQHNQQKSSRLSKLARALMFTVKLSTFCTLKHRRCTLNCPPQISPKNGSTCYLPSPCPLARLAAARRLSVVAAAAAAACGDGGGSCWQLSWLLCGAPDYLYHPRPCPRSLRRVTGFWTAGEVW